MAVRSVRFEQDISWIQV